VVAGGAQCARVQRVLGGGGRSGGRRSMTVRGTGISGGARPQVFRGRFCRVRRHGLVARTGDDQPIRVGRRMREGPGQAVAAGRPLAVRGKRTVN